MVKTDWDNIEGHYPVVAQRFVNALGNSPVRLALNLSAMGSDVQGRQDIPKASTTWIRR